MKRFVIWTHTDADGYLSGYIADNYIKDNPFVKSDIFYYNYNGICKEWNDISDEELKEATIVICDLSICDDIREIIKRCVTCGAEKIIHIDHHETSLKWMKENTDPLPEIYYTFFDKRVSAAFLCWVYSFIKPEHISPINNIWKNANPENVWDYSEN
jgi:oligoribonuclease NrnB/cAMP/cGMP phosphodiesterase (DHH superfamily)